MQTSTTTRKMSVNRFIDYQQNYDIKTSEEVDIHNHSTHALIHMTNKERGIVQSR